MKHIYPRRKSPCTLILEPGEIVVVHYTYDKSIFSDQGVLGVYDGRSGDCSRCLLSYKQCARNGCCGMNCTAFTKDCHAVYAVEDYI